MRNSEIIKNDKDGGGSNLHTEGNNINWSINNTVDQRFHGMNI